MNSELARLFKLYLTHTDLRLFGRSLRADVRDCSADHGCAMNMLALYRKRFTKLSSADCETLALV